MHLYALILALAVVIPGSAYDTWRSFDVDPLVAESVVWPEVERYSRLQDALETAANYGTYITTGGGPDFSIGLFQMKPSFVEEMEKAWMRSGLAREYELWFDTADNATARRIRISRLQKEEWQVIYVGVFLRLLYASYGSYNKKGERTQEGIETLPLKEQVCLAATAYNRGVVWAAPGYGDFPLVEQRTLLGLLDASRKVGVSLTDALLMVPSKSVSAVIGVRPSGSGGEEEGR